MARTVTAAQAKAKLAECVRHGPFSLAREGGVLLLFAVVATIRFYPALSTWFIFDDPRAMFYSTRPLGEIFLSRMYAPSYYTPLVGLTLRPDTLLFGLNPVMYHVHNSAVVVGICWVLYLIVRRHAPDSFTAIVAGLVLLLSPPTLVSVFWITLRQYLYAILFALIAVHLHLRRVTAPRPRLIETAAILVACELSFLGKEQFMTLPAVLFLLTPGSLSQRLHLTYPYFIVLALHAGLRYHVLGGPGGGPQALGFDATRYLSATLMSFPRTATVLFGSPVALVIVVSPWLRRWRALLLGLGVWIASLAVAFVAMGSLPTTDDQRYWLQAAVLLAVAIALGAAWIASPTMRFCYLALLLVWLAIHSVTAGRSLNDHFRREAALAAQLSRALIRPDLTGAAILWPATAYAHSDYLAHMARLYHMSGLALTRLGVYPRELLVLEPQLLGNHRRVYEVSPDGLRDILPATLREISQLRESQLAPIKPRVEVTIDGTLQIRLECPGPSPSLTLFSFRGSGLEFADTSPMPYRQEFSTGLIVDRKVHATLVPIDEVLSWNAGPHDDGTSWTELSAYAVACRYPDGRSTLLSDAVLVKRR
jgi:hypothetical protein